jgi:hypothetical protein
MKCWTSMVRNERGAAAVLIAVSVAAMLGFAALAIDLGMLFKARVDAQRAADAAALAGASAFLDFDQITAVTPARNRATEYGLRNTFLNGPIDTGEIYIKVIPDSFKVGVYVYRDSVQTWFARIFGIRYVPIGAFAAAAAVSAGQAKCLKPWAVPDVWHDYNSDTNNNRMWDPGEEWVFGDDPGDVYKPFSGPGGAADETGYGSEWRNPPYTQPVDDYGRQIQIKSPDPNDEYSAAPGIFYPWRLPIDPDQEPCDNGGGGGQDAGGAVYRQNICSCNNSPVQLGVPYEVEPGNMIGPTAQGVDELINEDPNASWDDATNQIVNSDPKFGDAMNSPRVIKIALIDPTQIQGSGMQTIMFNNFALLFLEEQANNQAPVKARFLYYASGEGSPGSTTGSLVKVLQLVK